MLDFHMLRVVIGVLFGVWLQASEPTWALEFSANQQLPTSTGIAARRTFIIGTTVGA